MSFLKKRSKEDVKTRVPLFGGKKANGEERVRGTYVEFNDGTSTTLLNPSGKGAKFAQELKDDCRYTNLGRVKTDINGVPLNLSEKQRVYRSGYLACLKDNSKAYKAKNGGK